LGGMETPWETSECINRFGEVPLDLRELAGRRGRLEGGTDRLARDFGAIVLAARSGEKLAEVGQQVKAIGAEPLVLELDLAIPTAAEVVVRKTLDRFGRIDALVNIAGAVAGLDVFEMTPTLCDGGDPSPILWWFNFAQA
jgi:NAD(P)-dependent dehydrogenase (short-subunit alcohol dehydrogenase family)